jgi:hypothetical protein
MTFSEVLSVKSQDDIFEAFAAVKDIFDEDLTAVYVQQFSRGATEKNISSRIFWERQAKHECFRKSRHWVKVQDSDDLQVNDRKRKVVEDGDHVVKRTRRSETVSFKQCFLG